MSEIWKDIKGYEGLYKVSNLGRIYSYKMNFILRPSIKDNGYLNIGLIKNGLRTNYNVHRLVASAFVPNPNPEINIIINHKNEIKTDNRAENLEWCTQKYNINYGSAKEKMSKGMLNYYNSLSGIEQKERLREMHLGLKQSEETIKKRVEKIKSLNETLTKEERSWKYMPQENRDKHSDYMKRRMSELTDEKRKELYGHKLDDDVQFKMRFSRDYGRKFEDIEFISPFDLEGETDIQLIKEFECGGEFAPLHIDDFRFPVIKGKRGIIHVKHEIEDQFDFENDTAFLN